MTQESPQGPSELRSVNSPQGEFPSQVIDTLAASPGGFITQIIANRPGMEAERNKPGDSTNQSGVSVGFPGRGPDVQGKFGKITGSPTMGSTLGKGTI